MTFVQELINAEGAETTDEQIDKACADLCVALKGRRDYRRKMAQLRTQEEKMRGKLNEAVDLIRETKLGFSL